MLPTEEIEALRAVARMAYPDAPEAAETYFQLLVEGVEQVGIEGVLEALERAELECIANLFSDWLREQAAHLPSTPPPEHSPRRSP